MDSLGRRNGIRDLVYVRDPRGGHVPEKEPDRAVTADATHHSTGTSSAKAPGQRLGYS